MLASELGTTTEACGALGISTSTYYRQKNRVKQADPAEQKKKRVPRALTETEREKVVEVLHEERFMDKSPYQIYSRLLDERVYVGSVSTMYRCLRSLHELKERRNLLRHPKYKTPELLAEKPNEIWSWDITKLKGPVKGCHYHLYVILDIFSRLVVGWLVAQSESGELAERLIEDTCRRQKIKRETLIIHTDRGSSMTSQTVAQLLDLLSVKSSFNRPHVSNDNPYSESQFKTMKYSCEFPERFGSIQDARIFLTDFFEFYNNEHYHSGIAYLTPAMIHYGRSRGVLQQRQEVLLLAYEEHPERFVNGIPMPAEPPTEVWINPPKKAEEKEEFSVTISSITTAPCVR